MAVEAPEALRINLDVISEHQRQLALRVAQRHPEVFEKWDKPGTNDAEKRRLMTEIESAEASYPGGLDAYTNRVVEKVRESKEASSMKGCSVSTPAMEKLQASSADFERMEKLGAEQLEHTGFVLVAGGLGERLNFPGIKVALPIETTSNKCFLQYYVEQLLEYEYQAAANKGLRRGDAAWRSIPLAIMTSDDTHERTVKLLEQHDYFGMNRAQVTLMKQDLVPAVADMNGRLVVENYHLVRKPHGHGDVHLLMHRTGLADKWVKEGRKWVVFFQDTNGLAFHAIPPAIGVSVARGFQINSICVQRRPGEAVGAICCLRGVAPHPLTVNIEYNQLDPLLRATVSPNGDVAEAGTQFSPFPGNINVLVFSAGMYSEELHKSHGLVPEFINPKFADAAKTRFTSPARLESMMQDFPRLVGPEVTVGVTEFERFISFSAVKNNLKDAEDKWKKTGVAESAATGETDIYYVNRWMLASVPGVEIEVKGEKLAVAGVELEMGARVVLGAQMGVLVSQVRSRFNPRRAPAAVIKISTRSTLVLDGDVTVDELHLDGDEKSVTPEVAIRGFRIERKEQRELIFDHPGDYVVSE